MTQTRWIALALLAAAGLVVSLVALGEIGHRTSVPRPRWAPPRLQNPTTVDAASNGQRLHLDPQRDYVVRMPATPLRGSGGLVVEGGHNVVIVGGEISIPWQGAQPPQDSRRGLYLAEQTGTVHVEGMRIGGPDLGEGINLSQGAGAIVQIENVRVEGVRARDEQNFSDNHSDLLQTWKGPRELRIDGLSGSTDYQGLFIAPNQFGAQPLTRLDLRRVDIRATHRCYCILLWELSSAPLSLHDVRIAPNALVDVRSSSWPRDGRWNAVKRRGAGAADAVPRGVAGLHYRSPFGR
ncbi:MAG TPA: hypothetical protein VGN78_13130 [Solirubrobacteraceae bacterium]|jgi:hypothetical protein|nr:hypothetical protein [Solirubrobacteraceae bacterium]